jgi:hypothetical protein
MFGGATRPQECLIWRSVAFSLALSMVAAQRRCTSPHGAGSAPGRLCRDLGAADGRWSGVYCRRHQAGGTAEVFFLMSLAHLMALA